MILVRNLKDVLCSLHFHRGEAEDGWRGNEHGPGSLARFLPMIAQTITAAFFIAEGIRRGQWSALVLGPGHRSSQAGPA